MAKLMDYCRCSMAETETLPIEFPELVIGTAGPIGVDIPASGTMKRWRRWLRPRGGIASLACTRR
jgi:hypothetical protein